MSKGGRQGADPVTTDLVHLYTQLDAVLGEISRSMGLTPQQAMLLCATADTGSPSMQELATRLGCDKSNVTGLVNRIEERSLIQRVADPDDGRVTRVTITPKGRRVLAEFQARVLATLGKTINGIDAERLRSITAQISVAGWKPEGVGELSATGR